MIKRLAHKYLANDYYSIHIDSSENTEVIHILQIHLKKNKLTIVSQDSFLDINEIFKKLKKDIPVLLVFTGKKIINKKVLKEPDYIQKVLFNKEPDGYYIQEYSKDGNILVSIARKEDIDNYLNLFKKNNQAILDFSLGPFILQSLILFMPEHKEIYTSGFKYNFNSGDLFHNLDQKNTIGEDLRIGDDRIKNLSLLPFAGFMCFFKKMDFFKNYGHFSQMQQESFSYKIIFMFLAKAILIVFLFLLTTSYVLKNYYFGMSTEIQQEAIINRQVLDEIVTLKKDRDYKKNIISNSSLGSKYPISFYISQMAKDLPQDILLEKLEIFPAKTSRNLNEKILIKPNTIEVNGITPSRISVNTWVGILNNYEWVKNVELLSYALKKNEYVFKLNITI